MARLGDLLASASRRLEAAGVTSARANAEWMLAEVLGFSRASLVAHPDLSLAPDQQAAFEAMVARRERREPLQYILGHTDFYGLRLRVTPAVLIPRPETEELVEEALRRLEGRRAPWVLDAGTGSGAIALAIKHERPDAELFACEASEEALAVAAENAARLGLEATLVHSDLLAPTFADGVPACFDLIVSNPPYIPDDERAELAPEVRDFEPAQALFPGDDPLIFYRTLCAHARRLLKPDGHLLLETHADRAEEVAELLRAAAFRAVEVRQDLAGRQRIVGAVRPPAQGGR